MTVRWRPSGHMTRAHVFELKQLNWGALPTIPLGEAPHARKIEELKVKLRLRIQFGWSVALSSKDHA